MDHNFSLLQYRDIVSIEMQVLFSVIPSVSSFFMGWLYPYAGLFQSGILLQGSTCFIIHVKWGVKCASSSNNKNKASYSLWLANPWTNHKLVQTAGFKSFSQNLFTDSDGNTHYLLVERIQSSDFIIRLSDGTQTLSLGSSVTLGKLLYLDLNVLSLKWE